MTTPAGSAGPRRHLTALALAVVVAVVMLGAVACGSSHPAATVPGGGGPSPTTAAPGGYSTSPTSGTTATTPAPPATTAALASALTGAYRTETAALATYRNVVAALGPLGPFPNIIQAEEQHVSTVTSLLGRYSVAVPAATGGQASPATLTAACSLGVSVEQQVITFYNGQMPNVSGYADVTTAFENLKSAAQDSHLPAFEHCA